MTPITQRTHRLPAALRAGADDALQVPSRVNDLLYYRDGRVTGLQGQKVVVA